MFYLKNEAGSGNLTQIKYFFELITVGTHIP